MSAIPYEVIQAGKITMGFGKGHLRNIRYDGREMIGMIYFAVRDANWNTVENKVENLTIEENEDTLRLDFDCLCQSADIDLRWKCRIEVTGQTVMFEIRGKAHSDFQRNRIGFCVLHPLHGKGQTVTVTHSDGKETSGRFPETIAPWQPIKDIQKMRWSNQNIEAELSFEGDIFEMEDQRNWADASFKTYSTPLAQPFPVAVRSGEEVYQKIRCRFTEKSSRTSSVGLEKFALNITGGESKIPRLGLEANGEEMDDFIVSKIKSLNLSHLRVEEQLYKSDWLSQFRKKQNQARELGLPIELIIFTENSIDAGLELLQKELLGREIISILPINIHEKSTSEVYLKGIIPKLRLLFPRVPIGGGTDYYFAEYNRFPPPFRLIDFVSFSVNPQVHAFDDLTLVENNQALGDLVQTARSLAGPFPVHISPITLKPRHNPDKTNEIGEAPSQNHRIDARHSTHFNALWTLNCFKQLAQADASHLTFFHTLGAEGLIERENIVNRKSSDAAIYKVFPVFNFFKILGDFKEGKVIHSISSHPTVFEGLILEKNCSRLCVVANYRNEAIIIAIENEKYSIPPVHLTQINL